MPPIDLLRLAAETRDEATIRRVLGPLSEAERAEVAPLAREIVAAEVARGVDALHLGVMLLFGYGVLPATEVRKLGWRSNHLQVEAVDVLRGRSPERLGPIVDDLLERVGGGRAWRVVRQLVREGVIARPDSPAYTIGMLSATAWGRSASELVAADPGLLEVEAWRLFEVEGGGEDSLANHEKFHGDGWGDTFRSMAAADPAIRDRLLDASLAALGRDFSQYRAGWFSRFHESLDPTDEERAARVDAYLGLLRSRVGPTVSFSVAALGRVEKAGLLPAAALFDRIGPVLSEGPAGTAKAGLDLVARSAARSPDDAARAAVVAAEGFRHPASDVQKAATALVGRLAPEPDPELAALIAARLPEVAASQRPMVVALVERLGGSADVGPVDIAPATVVSPSAVRSPLDASRSIEPVASVEELVDVAVSVIETGEPADDIERVLEGVRRFPDVRSEPASRLVAPIAKRTRTLLGRRDAIPFNGFDARADVAAVLLAWTTGEVVPSADVHRTADAGAGAFLSARARATADALARGQVLPSVALPTHRGGWIEPRVLVDRLAAGPPASSLDFIAAVLRLAPEGHREALVAAAGLRGEEGAVLRYALGGKESIGRTAAWWVAAARVRSPGVDDVAVDRRHPRFGPEAALAARIELRITKPKGTYEMLVLDVQPPPTGRAGVDVPTALMLTRTTQFSWLGRSDPATLRWIATIQPGYRETWAAVGSLLIGGNLDWWSADWANRAFLEPFLEPWAPIGPHAEALVGIALGAKERGERGLATDVARLGIADGRLDAAGLSRGLAAATAVHLDKPQRWALSLADVASESDAHARVVAEAIAAALPSVVTRPPGSLVPLLRLLDELLAASLAPVAPAARPSLEALSAMSGQAGRLARAIRIRGAD